MKNPAASIKDRLQNHARANQLALNPLLERFALGRFIARLGASPHADRFVLKGAQLFALWAEEPHRPTRDADFLSFGAHDVEALERIIDEICALPSDPPDGLNWEAAKAAPIREDNIYGGVRVKVSAKLGNARIPLQIDIGFGDSIIPEPRLVQWQEMLDFPPVELLAYSPETVIAEKLEAAVTLGTGNSRMKDFYDLLWLARNMDFDGAVLTSAIAATFERRKTPLPTDRPVALTDSFASFPGKAIQWDAFLRKGKLDPSDLNSVVGEIADFLMPVILGEVADLQWTESDGWHTKR